MGNASEESRQVSELKTEAVTFDGKREIGRERIEDHPEMREAFDWYVEYQWEPWAAAERPRRKTIAPLQPAVLAPAGHLVRGC